MNAAKPTKKTFWRRRLIVAGVLAALGGVGAWLFFGYFAFHLMWVDDVTEADEVVFATGESVDVDDEIAAALADVESGGTGATSEPADDAAGAGATSDDAPAGAGTADDDTADDTGSTAGEGAVQPDAETVMPGEEATGGPTGGSTEAESGIQIIAIGEFVRRSHPGTGVVAVVSDGEQMILRFDDDFATDNGPGLDVYLSTAAPAATVPAGEFDDDFINLGDLEGNIGSQNYEIPAGTDLTEYSTVVVWCVPFGVAFTAADLVMIGGI